MRDLLDKLSSIDNLEESNTPEIGDEFGISFSPDFEISTHVVEVLEDGIVVELDDTALEMLTNEGVRFFEGELVEGVAGPKSCWKGYRKTGTQPGTGKNAGKRVNDCEKISEDAPASVRGAAGLALGGVTAIGVIPLIGIFGPILGMGIGAVSVYNAAKMGMNSADAIWDWAAKKLGGNDNAEDFAKAHINASLKGEPAFEYNGKTFDVKATPQQAKAAGAEVRKVAESRRTQGGAEGNIDEAEYQGRNVPLGKKMAGDVKKSKVYVKNPQGNVVKVNFGDKKMLIKKSNPARRKSFRARHNCANPGPRHRARYWSCRSW